MGKRALVIGLGMSGLSAIEFLLEKGYELWGFGEKKFSVHPKIFSMSIPIIAEESDLPQDLEMAVISPGFPSGHPIVRILQDRNILIMGEAALGLSHLPNLCLGITGTNGKTTVTLLVEHVLRESGRKARALGNVGAPLARYALDSDPEEILVVELSSYQLETLSCPVFSAAALLNITPDHLDRYVDLDAYAQAKVQIRHCLKPGGRLYVGPQVQAEYDRLLAGQGEPFLELELQGAPHDCQNARAAWSLCEAVGITREEFLSAIKSFKKPAHRIEWVLEKNGVHFFDDSKGTNVDAVIQAVHAMPGPVILIAGGVDKGSSYLPWKDLSDKVRCIILIGEAAPKIQGDLALFFNLEIVDSLKRAVLRAKSIARRGECVLLSPGCSSYDMFRDYTHRGEEFQKFVRMEGEDDS